MNHSTNRLVLKSETDAQRTADRLHKEIDRRIAAAPRGLCPVDTALSFVTLCLSQSCGKCVPCRVGLAQLANLLRDVLDGGAREDTLDLIRETAESVYDSADCAIGYEAAKLVLRSVLAFRDDFMEHITKGRCLGNTQMPVPCMGDCPANVDIPGYIALVKEGRCAEAVRLIRKDNPFPVACAYVCEHPCENHCRRMLIDDALNIRGLKRYAVDEAGVVPAPPCAEATGRKIAVIGGGPSGLTAAYYLSLMGHKVTVFEKRARLGGMLRYGIPKYRFPRELLDRDIAAILSTGVEVKLNTGVGEDVTMDELTRDYDSIYVSIGAHADGKARIEGETLHGVIPAVQLLRGIGDEDYPDFTGKKVVVIGGGNVAMDVTRTAVRLGAESVTCVYRRRQADMTAAAEEIEGAIAEGAELVMLKAPVRVEDDGNGNAAAIWVKPQIPGKIDAGGRPRPMDADLPEERIPADLVIMAIGQKIESAAFEAAGIPVNRGAILTDAGCRVGDTKIFAGGDCVSGPATAIRAIAAGKSAAANIDRFLGYCHEISVDVDIPAAGCSDKEAQGRVNMTERLAARRKCDFDCIECGMTKEAAVLEASRCLRCDHFGMGTCKGGDKW